MHGKQLGAVRIGAERVAARGEYPRTALRVPARFKRGAAQGRAIEEASSRGVSALGDLVKVGQLAQIAAGPVDREELALFRGIGAQLIRVGRGGEDHALPVCA